MDGGGADGSPHGVIVGEGGVHGEDVADELVVGVEGGDVREGDQGEEERDYSEKKNLCPTDGGLGGGGEHGGILAGWGSRTRGQWGT